MEREGGLVVTLLQPTDVAVKDSFAHISKILTFFLTLHVNMATFRSVLLETQVFSSSIISLFHRRCTHDWLVVLCCTR